MRSVRPRDAYYARYEGHRTFVYRQCASGKPPPIPGPAAESAGQRLDVLKQSEEHLARTIAEHVVRIEQLEDRLAERTQTALRLERRTEDLLAACPSNRSAEPGRSE